VTHGVRIGSHNPLVPSSTLGEAHWLNLENNDCGVAKGHLKMTKCSVWALVITPLFLGCGSDQSRREEVAPAELTEPQWRLTSATSAQGVPIEAFDAEVAGPIDMRFFDKYMLWDDNCNGLNGRYAVEGQSLRITGPGLPTTLVGCLPQHVRARDAVAQSFLTEMTWNVTSSGGATTLVLTSLVDGSVATLAARPK
jgi:hypothetical protein